MAVRAHYPSNVLITRNGQEDHEYSMIQRPQLGGSFDHSHVLFSSGVMANPGKRGRDMEMNALMYMQTQQSDHQIDLASQFYNNQQANVVSTGLKLSFGDQQLHQRHQQSYDSNHQSAFLSLMSADFATQIKQQTDEIDQFLQTQEEQLRRTLAQKQQRNYLTLLGTAEELLSRKLREKDAEMDRATRRTAELQARMAELTVEAQEWQARAKAQEAMAAALQAQLQQAIMCGRGAPPDRWGEEGFGVGCAEGAEKLAEDAESGYIDPERVEIGGGGGPSCIACRRGVASVVLLPCRHMCICTECDKVAQACPLCLSFTTSSLEVFLS